MEITKEKPLAEVVTQEEFDKFMQLPAEVQANMAQEFLDHVHTLWNSIGNLYNEYAMPLAVLGMHLELNIFAGDRQMSHAELGIKKGFIDIVHELKKEKETGS